jgi:hypothetical protein
MLAIEIKFSIFTGQQIWYVFSLFLVWGIKVGKSSLET